MLAEFGADVAPALAGIVSVIKQCPTPDGKGVHMVLNTERGPGYRHLHARTRR